MLPSVHLKTSIIYQKGNHYASINYISISCIGWVVEPSASAISGKTCGCKVEHRLGPVHSESPRSSAFETLPVVSNAKPPCLRSHCALPCDGWAAFHICLAPVTALLCFHQLGLQVWGEANDLQSLLVLGDAGAAADQVCNVQRVTLENEAWRWVKISSTESASSVCGWCFFSLCVNSV